jgi:putative ABC transport system permease protein
MTFRDLVVVSAGNLWRMKLRTFLTTSGVLVAIAAFVSMLSFGAGNQQNVEQEFNKLGLFTTMQVYPKNTSSDSESVPKLDRAALDRIAAVRGVNLVYPYDAFTVHVRLGDSVVTARAQALPTAAVRTKLFSDLEAGSVFDSNSSRQALISDDLAKKAGILQPDSAVGKPIVVSVRVSVIDSGLAHIVVDRGESILNRIRRIDPDSLFYRPYRSRVIRSEVNEVARRFISGFINAQESVSDTLVICGIRHGGRMGRMRIESIIIPVSTATRFSSSGLGGSPTEIIAAMGSGTLFSRPGDEGGRTFSQVTIDFDPKVPYTVVKDGVEALGFRTFSFAAQFEEIQRVFLYFDLALGVVGLIALFTASLGIVNTMVMSILERTRDIGIMKAIGGGDEDIRWIFLVEASLIGLLGGVGGLLLGWLVGRGINYGANWYLRTQDVPATNLFLIPWWLVGGGIGFALVVSVIAGSFPAMRAARLDPIQALRHD